MAITESTDAARDGTALAGVVLAGGNSRRYGDRNKLLETFEGTPIVQRVCRALGASTDAPPIVAVQTSSQRDAIERALDERVDVRFEFDHPEFDGPLAGISSVVEAVDAPWLIVGAGDMPLVSSVAIERLAERRAAETDAVVPVRDGRREPLHGVYRRTALADALETVPASAGVRALCSAVTCTEVPVEDEPGQLSRSVRNVNTREELERLAARAVGVER